MHVLGISSATKVVSIGLVENEQLLFETTVANVQSESILFYVQEAGIKPADINGIAVAMGPGSYSGLRGGVATAKALSATLDIPLVGISTLEAIAYNLVEIEGTMAVVLDARQAEYNFALFGASKGKLKRIIDDMVIKLDLLLGKLSAISGPIRLVGNLSAIENKIQGENFHFADPLHSHPYGINVAKLGLQRFQAGKKDDPLTMVPNYSHLPKIREFKEERK